MIKVIGKIDLDNITDQDLTKYKTDKTVLKTIYDMKSCSYQFGYKCDQEIPLSARIVGYEK